MEGLQQPLPHTHNDRDKATRLLDAKKLLSKICKTMPLFPLKNKDTVFNSSSSTIPSGTSQIQVQLPPIPSPNTAQAFHEQMLLDSIEELGYTNEEAIGFGKEFCALDLIRQVYSPKKCNGINPKLWTFSLNHEMIREEKSWTKATEAELKDIQTRLKLKQPITSPWDKAWLDNTSPRFMPAVQLETEYDLVVLGSELGGIACAEDAAKRGHSVLLIEPIMIGGRFLFKEWIPRHCLQQLTECTSRDKSIPFQELMDSMKKKRFELSERYSAARLSSLVHLVMGKHASFKTGENVIEMGSHLISFKKAVVALGSVETVSRDIIGLSSIRFMTASDISSLPRLPKTVGIVGGGPCACELATTLSLLGSKVVMLTRKPLVLSTASKKISTIYMDGLKSVKVQTYSRVSGLSLEMSSNSVNDGQGHIQQSVRMAFVKNNIRMEKVVDEIIICGGRRPDLKECRLDPLAQINDFLESGSNRSILMVGSCCSPLNTPNISETMGKLVAHNLSLRFPWKIWDRRRFSSCLTPTIVHGVVPVAIVGAVRRELKGMDLEVFEMNLSSIPGAIVKENIPGMAIITCLRSSKVILRAEVVGNNAEHLIEPFCTAIAMNIPLQKLALIDHVYPSMHRLGQVLAEGLHDCRKKSLEL